ncbi:MAG TPA: hypothetical protein VKV37_19175 [Ktedonobacteraceae bacterium]|jgi:hypothetical protein|nr:hypothetical protein [Ktedonobacteraceae bacterium]
MNSLGSIEMNSLRIFMSPAHRPSSLAHDLERLGMGYGLSEG